MDQSDTAASDIRPGPYPMSAIKTEHKARLSVSHNQIFPSVYGYWCIPPPEGGQLAPVWTPQQLHWHLLVPCCSPLALLTLQACLSSSEYRPAKVLRLHTTP